MKFTSIDQLSVPVDWDYDRFAESIKKRESGKYFADHPLGFITKPATLVDKHGKILMWYLPDLLLPPRVVCSCPESLVLANFVVRRSSIQLH